MVPALGSGRPGAGCARSCILGIDRTADAHPSVRPHSVPDGGYSPVPGRLRRSAYGGCRPVRSCVRPPRAAGRGIRPPSRRHPAMPSPPPGRPRRLPTCWRQRHARAHPRGAGPRSLAAPAQPPLTPTSLPHPRQPKPARRPTRTPSSPMRRHHAYPSPAGRRHRGVAPGGGRGSPVDPQHTALALPPGPRQPVPGVWGVRPSGPGTDLAHRAASPRPELPPSSVSGCASLRAEGSSELASGDQLGLDPYEHRVP